MHDAYLDTISGRRRGLAAACARGALSLCTPAYDSAVRYRNWRFDQPHSSVGVPVPVISVGNLTTGGTGKTPVVAWVINRLMQEGRRPAILSRGYKSLDGSSNDEKRLLDRLCAGVPHIQNPDRVAGANEAIARYGSDVLVLDDGFQHRRLRRDLDLVLIDALNPWGYGHLLPRGLMREPKSSLRRASLVLITRSELCEPSAVGLLSAEISRHTSAPIVLSEFRPQSLVDAAGAATSLESVCGRRVLAFCGIGNPDGFRRTLATIDSRLANPALLAFPDHHHYRDADRQRIADLAQSTGAELLLTTEKDLVKLPESIGGVPVRAVRIGLTIADGAARLCNSLDSVIQQRAAA
jgi:tetraacyldisaccharide 4'-kinase